MRLAATALYLSSLAVYAVSFLLPTFEIVVEGRGEREYGFAAFEVSFLAFAQEMFAGPTAFVLWLANPAFWAGAVLFVRGRHGAALAASCASVLLGGRFLFAPLILVGYYVWLTGMALLLAACMVRLLWS